MPSTQHTTRQKRVGTGVHVAIAHTHRACHECSHVHALRAPRSSSSAGTTSTFLHLASTASSRARGPLLACQPCSFDSRTAHVPAGGGGASVGVVRRGAGTVARVSSGAQALLARARGPWTTTHLAQWRWHHDTGAAQRHRRNPSPAPRHTVPGTRTQPGHTGPRLPQRTRSLAQPSGIWQGHPSPVASGEEPGVGHMGDMAGRGQQLPWCEHHRVAFTRR